MATPSAAHILVVGATGKQGSAVVRALQALPNPPKLRALSRNPSSPVAQKLKDQGIEVFKGDLADPRSLDTALAGVKSAFLVTTIPGKGAPTEDEQGKTFVEAAKRAALPFLVYTSVSDASPTCGVPHFETKAIVEQALKDSGLKHAVVAPTAFYDNFPSASGFVLMMVLGVFDAGLRGKKVQLVSSDDIGYVAAHMLNDPDKYAGRHVKLAGDELSMAEVQAVYSRVEGKDVWKAWLPSWLTALLPHDFRAMLNFFHEHGYTADIAALKREFSLKSLEEWMRAQRKAE
ncbi:hypothetical protein JCM9279_005708 [Rhodotorula babjevae]